MINTGEAGIRCIKGKEFIQKEGERRGVNSEKKNE